MMSGYVCYLFDISVIFVFIDVNYPLSKVTPTNRQTTLAIISGIIHPYTLDMYYHLNYLYKVIESLIIVNVQLCNITQKSTQ